MALTPISTTQVPLTPEEQQIYNQIKFTGSSSTQGNISQYYEYAGKQYSVNLDTSKLPPGPGALAYTDAQKAVLAAISSGTSAAPTTVPGIPIYQSPGVVSTVPAPISPMERVQQGIVPTPSSTLPVPPPAQPVPQPAPQVGGVQPQVQPQSTPLTQQQYFLQPRETPEQYNQRIAQLRGDTPQNLANVQQLTQQKTGAGFQQTSQQLAQQPQSAQVAPQSIQPAQAPSADGGLLQQTGLPSELSSTTIEDVIQKVSAAFGLTDVTKELKKVTDQEGEEIQEANENPWISEGLRVKKIQAIQGKYEGKKNALVERLRLQQDVVGKAIDVYYREKEFKMDALFKQFDLEARQYENMKFDTQVVEARGRKLLINSQTGETIMDLGVSKVLGDPTGTIPPVPTPGTLPPGVKLSTAQQEDVSNSRTLIGLLDQIDGLGDSMGWSGVGGLYQGSIAQFLAKNFGAGTTEEQNLRNLIGNVKGTVAKLRGGTSFTPNEEKLLDTYTPSIDDSSLVIQSKLDSLRNFLNTKIQSVVSVAGGNVGPTTPTGGTTYSPGTILNSDGKLWLVGLDGETVEPIGSAVP